MGNWHISIEGVGCHHNAIESDAEQMTAEFVDRLRRAGHSLVKTSFTFGGALDPSKKEDLLPIKAMLPTNKKKEE